MYRCTVYHGTAAICISIELYGAREGARRNVRPDAPNTNYIIMLIVNKRQTMRFVLLQCYALYAAH